ncbi:DMT family transporter [Kaistella sp. 97-N-M2]|uniref:DMT family transporter n=1 Tax=Kaistella sp. 97-N-M2 TaxID=2908645 RepID=UPI001F2CC9C4|nr:DMT family transporter [Kaistella sp. 97-N-M2]UJF29664.1 DMT family transporter [Kaistella sp. 97-N-M2]
MLAIFITILGHISYGTTNVLWKNPRNEVGTLPLILIRSACCFLIFFSSYFVLTGLQIIPKTQFSWIDVMQTAGICAVNYFGLFFFLQSMKHTQVSNTIGFGKIGLIIGVAAGYFLYGEEISALKIFLCIVVLIGVSLIEVSARKKASFLSKGLLYTVLAKIFWSTAYLYVPFIEKLGPVLFCAVLEFTVFSLSFVLFFFDPAKLNLRNISSTTKKEIGLLIFLGTLGTFCLNFALANMSIILFAIIGLIEPILGLLISKLYQKERLAQYQKIGIGLGILSAFILSVTK